MNIDIGLFVLLSENEYKQKVHPNFKVTQYVFSANLTLIRNAERRPLTSISIYHFSSEAYPIHLSSS